MQFRRKKTKKNILKEELLRFKKRVEKRFDKYPSYYKSPFVKPFVKWDTEEDGKLKCIWNDVTIRLFFSTKE